MGLSSQRSPRSIASDCGFHPAADAGDFVDELVSFKNERSSGRNVGTILSLSGPLAERDLAGLVSSLCLVEPQ